MPPQDDCKILFVVIVVVAAKIKILNKIKIQLAQADVAVVFYAINHRSLPNQKRGSLSVFLCISFLFSSPERTAAQR